MDRSKRLLVAIDDSGASNRAVRYVGEILGGTQGFTVFLLHMLGPLPAQLGAFRDAETREGEEKPEEAVVRKQNQPIKKSAAEVRPILEKAKAMLTRAGVPCEAIERDCPVWVNREDLVTDILHEARDRDCATVVIGRESFAGLKEMFVGHIADELIREGRGLAFWGVWNKGVRIGVVLVDRASSESFWLNFHPSFMAPFTIRCLALLRS